MIPNIIHQIWIGPQKMPSEWMQTWRNKNPSMKYMLWREKELESFGLRFQDKISYLMGKGIFSGASDIIRIEILCQFGGVYVDADSICIESIENASFMKENFFVGKDYDHKRKRFVDNIANGTIGSVSESPILKKYLERINNAGVTKWWDLGGRMLKYCIKDEDVCVLPVCTFTPENWDGIKALVEGKIYAHHKWGMTTGLY